MIDLNGAKIILGSASPRRKTLLQDLHIPFEVRVSDCDESEIKEKDVIKLSQKITLLKSKALLQNANSHEVIITADTIVYYKDIILGKPHTLKEAKNNLLFLSGKTHNVITTVCIANKYKNDLFSSITKVTFSNLSEEDIDYYVKTYKPLDKAGAYGIQEWIGIIGIEKIDGDYETVIGLPTQLLYKHLKEFLQDDN
ncbi:MAG: Maf family protein [Bacteroidales bacterium]|jgi:septum formation protein